MSLRSGRDAWRALRRTVPTSGVDVDSALLDRLHTDRRTSSRPGCTAARARTGPCSRSLSCWDPVHRDPPVRAVGPGTS
ncbi:hypothetical protein HBB16_07940 [Pseudonocardia sp. MCCB 268]|nr:hypothetical protein [Pseudonocardia cytotoxica]